MEGAYFIGLIIYCIICGVICKAIASSRGMEGGFWWGFWLNIIGIIIVAVRPNDNKPAYANTTSTPSSPRDREREILADGGWKCDCGMVNYKYVTSCSCGRSKWDVEQKRYRERQEAEKAAVERVEIKKAAAGKAAAEKKPEEVNAIPSSTQTTNNLTEADIVKYLKDYKELLDAEVLTHEEFERKKAQLLQNLAIDTKNLGEVEVIKHLKDYKELLDTRILTPKEFEEIKRELLQDEEQKRLKEQRKKEEEQKRIEEQKRLEEQRRKEEEQKRLEEQRRKEEEEQKRLEELNRRQEERKKEEEQKRLEEQRRKEEEQKRLEEEEQRLLVEQKNAEVKRQLGFYTNMPHIFYCKNCGAAFGGISKNKPEKCEKCNYPISETTITREEWRTLSSEQKVQALFDDGILTQEEYEAKKRKLQEK